MIQQTDRLDTYGGCLLGLAVGDALGTTLESKKRGSFEPLKDIVGGGPYHLKPGEWTDDTSMAMCLTESLLARGGFDAKDQMERYCQWHEAGYWSCRPHSFGIGKTTRAALKAYRETGQIFAGSTNIESSGNGSLMRLAPIPLYFVNRPESALSHASESSRTTHGSSLCVDACRFYCGVLIGAVLGEKKETLLSPRYCPVKDYYQEQPLCPEIDAIAAGSYKEKPDFFIKSTGYVLHTLETALWGFYRGQSFIDGLIKVVNLGGDSDTAGAVYGQLAGAYYGLQDIPESWVELIAYNRQILNLARHLYRASLP